MEAGVTEAEESLEDTSGETRKQIEEAKEDVQQGLEDGKDEAQPGESWGVVGKLLLWAGVGRFLFRVSSQAETPEITAPRIGLSRFVSSVSRLSNGIGRPPSVTSATRLSPVKRGTVEPGTSVTKPPVALTSELAQRRMYC